MESDKILLALLDASVDVDECDQRYLVISCDDIDIYTQDSQSESMYDNVAIQRDIFSSRSVVLL